MRAGLLRQCTRRLLWLAIASGFALLFSGCVNIQFSSEFNRDGTAYHTLAVIIPREEFDEAEASEFLALWDEILVSASEVGLEPVRTDTAESVTFQVSVQRPNGDDAGAALNSLLNATGLNPSPGIMAPFQGYYEQRGTPVGGTEFVLDMTVDGEQLVEALMSVEQTQGLDPSFVDDVALTYQVSIPGSLNTTTADETTDEHLIWHIDKQGITELNAGSSAGRADRAALFIIAALISLAAVLVIGTIMGALLARRPALASSIGSAARYFPRRTTITDEGLWVAYRVRLLVERIWHTVAPHGETPVQHELLESAVESEGEDDGTNAEGDRPAAGVRGG